MPKYSLTYSTTNIVKHWVHIDGFRFSPRKLCNILGQILAFSEEGLSDKELTVLEKAGILMQTYNEAHRVHGWDVTATGHKLCSALKERIRNRRILKSRTVSQIKEGV